MCSGPTIEDNQAAQALSDQRHPDKRKAPRPPRIGPDGEPLEDAANDHIRRSEDAKERSRSRVGTPGFEAPGLAVGPPGVEADTTVHYSRPLINGPTTIGRFALNHTRPTGITALKPGFPRIGR